ncbi:hypothetical protein [Actinomyces weissii]|uniref:hypothetical protein n=1 Tax=Actinomyces weissii TaxID=675090 RepID=UPI001F247AF1|nr:hypothetical protein [Actinomyces weissii]
MTALLVLLTGLVSTTPRMLCALCGWRTPWARKRVGLATAVLVGLLGAWVGLGPLRLHPGLPLLLVLLTPLGWILWGLRVVNAEAGFRARAVLWRAATLLLLVAFLVLTQPAAPSVAQGACAATGVVLLLTDPANDVVAALLHTVRPAALQHSLGQPVEQGGGLLGGGRWIGTLERLLVLVLAFSTAAAAIAAVVAAKGVIRFPEISADVPRPQQDQPSAGGRGPAGAKAEEFLIGSFASWGLALLGYLLLSALGLSVAGGGGGL